MRKKTCSWCQVKIERFGRKSKTLCGDFGLDESAKIISKFCPKCGGEVEGGDGMRYKIFEGSQSAHCCFVSTVVDTMKPDVANGQHLKSDDGQLRYEPLCECFDRDNAERICAALNGITIIERGEIETQDTTKERR